jgi:phage terminase large subunit
MISVEIPKKAINPVYLPHLDNQHRIQIFFGGASSGKSKFVVGQRTVYHLLKGGHNYLICRQTKTSIRGSVSTEVQKVIAEWGLSDLFTINKTDGTVTCQNGYQAVFAGLDDVEKLKSIAFKKGVLTDIVVEEATETDHNSIKQLFKRQRGKVDEGIKKTLTLLFNPIFLSHWIYKEYFSKLGWADGQKEYKSDRISILKTTYKDNRFLEPEDIADLENESDPYYYNVYSLGNWGVLGNVIFTNWIVADLNDPDGEHYLPDTHRTNRRNGLDFGFSTDPAAVGRSHYDKKHKRIYFFDELYETGLTNDILADRVIKMIGVWREHEETKERIFDGTELITCDSSEPKSIAEIKRLGVNARGAKKGKDSVVHGIQWLQQQTIIVDKSCINMQAELQVAKWKEDAGGNVVKSGGLPVPVDKNNHLIDQLRYAFEDDALDIGEMEVIESPFFN